MVRQPHSGRISLSDRIWTRRRRRRFRPIGRPIIILRNGLPCHFFNLVRTKSGVPNHLPFRCQTLQMDQAILAAGTSIPPVITDLNLRCRRFHDALGVGGQFLDLIDNPVLLTQPGESSFIASRMPIPRKNNKQCTCHHCQQARQQCRPLTMFCTNRFMHRGNKSNYEHHGQQLNERISVSCRVAFLI